MKSDMNEAKETLGETIRKKRIENEISLRRFAELISISPTMQSKIERDEPGLRVSAELIKKIANRLNLNSDELLAKARKIDEDIQAAISDKSHAWPLFLRTYKDASEEELLKMVENYKKLKE